VGTPLPLARLHQALHAQFREEDGWDVVATYTSPAAEHRAVRRAAGLCDLSHRGLLEVRGPDRATWLHNLLTNDVKSLTSGHGCYTALLTPQGKVLGDAHLFALPDSLLIDCEASLTAKLHAGLTKYRITERVELHDRAAEFCLLSIQGPQAPTILSTWAGPTACPPNELDHVSYHINGISILIARCSVTGDPGFHCFVPTTRLPELWQRLLAAGRPFGLTPCGMDALESLRIEAGLPRYGRDFDESVLLPEVGLERAVSDTKGCYVGQEFVIRIRDRGRVNRHLGALAIEGMAAALHGDPITAGDREIGTVTSSAFVPTHDRALALGYLHRDYLQPGTAVAVRLASGVCPATVVRPTVVHPPGPALEPEEPHEPHAHDH